MADQDQYRIRRAYMDLLELSHGELRARLQPVLATIRDEVARGAGRDPEHIQNIYEKFVRENPRPAGGWDHAPQSPAAGQAVR